MSDDLKTRISRLEIERSYWKTLAEVFRDGAEDVALMLNDAVKYAERGHTGAAMAIVEGAAEGFSAEEVVKQRRTRQMEVAVREILETLEQTGEANSPDRDDS